MTCPSLIPGSPVAADVLGGQPEAPEERPRSTSERLLTRFRQDDAWAQLARFVIVGGSSTLLYALLFLALHPLGYLPAHVTATVLSSVYANETHRRLTFHAGERVGWLTAQWEAGSVSLVGLLATSAALRWLASTTADAPAMLQIALVVSITTLIGAMRFVALRWIFRPEPAVGA